MLKYPEAKEMIEELYRTHRTWQKVADELSSRIDKTINVGFLHMVWQGKKNSDDVYVALGLQPRTIFERTVSFSSLQGMKDFEAFLEDLDMSIGQFCEAILDGKIEVTKVENDI